MSKPWKPNRAGLKRRYPRGTSVWVGDRHGVVSSYGRESINPETVGVVFDHTTTPVLVHWTHLEVKS